jgi:hypothetical protein
VTYRCISGHGETNAAALDRAGIVPWIRTPADLAPQLSRALATPPRNLWDLQEQDRFDVIGTRSWTARCRRSPDRSAHRS